MDSTVLCRMDGVVPRAGTWIEIGCRRRCRYIRLVVPRAGTWIEIPYSPSDVYAVFVVPRAGTWIEMTRGNYLNLSPWVVPRAGTWIEIRDYREKTRSMTSSPVRGRGLKLGLGGC